MQISILAIGRIKSGPDLSLFERYMDRTSKSGKSLHLSGPDLREFNESRSASTNLRKQEEATQLLSAVLPNSYLMALDENGRDVSSVQFAEIIRNLRDDGIRHLAIAIGGPDGHGQDLLKKANKTIRFGALTWPHQLVRILLAEQIYRATTILSGHPYHRP
ncbi:MAG: 23S rRNA (pseudouridine(1915)-N(3))-methyltransferase RlmH [Rhizobiaceae bacterium]